MRAEGVGCRDWASDFRVQGLGFQDLGFRVQGLGARGPPWMGRKVEGGSPRISMSGSGSDVPIRVPAPRSRREGLDVRTRILMPLSSEFGTGHRQARFWLCFVPFSGQSPEDVFSRSLYARERIRKKGGVWRQRASEIRPERPRSNRSENLRCILGRSIYSINLCQMLPCNA